MSEDKEDKDLRKVFEHYEKLLFKAANSSSSESVYGYKQSFYKKVDEATKSFKQRAKQFVDKDIPNTNMSSDAEEILRRAGAFNETANVKLTTYVQMVSKLTASAEQFKGRIQARIDENDKKGTTTTVTDLRDFINDELRSGKGITVKYENGTEMPTDKYAAMLARTTKMETHNIAMVGKALDDGNDLVECSTVLPTCDICAVYQGRIYSISGNTPGYPSLYDTAFKHGYSIIHPNCRHQFYPYNPKFHTEEERQALEEGTRRPWDEKGNTQGEAARAAYARSQMQMRQWNNELNKYAEYKKLCEERGEKPAYSNLGAFRRAYRSEEGSLAYAKSHYAHRDARQYKEFEKVIGKEKMPESLAKFQEMKYNKDKQKYSSLQIKVEDEKVRRKLGSNELPLTIQTDKQGKHIKGHKNFTDDKSYLAVGTVEDGLRLSQEIVDKYHGKGTLNYNKNKENIKEKVVTDLIVGYVFSNKLNKWVTTKAVTIHYSKSGTHIVPTIISTGGQK